MYFTVGQPFFMAPRFLDELRKALQGLANSEVARGTVLRLVPYLTPCFPDKAPGHFAKILKRANLSGGRR